MSCPSWQWHRSGSRWSPVRTLLVAPLWCDLGFFPNSRGNKAAVNLSPKRSHDNCNEQNKVVEYNLMKSSDFISGGPAVTCTKINNCLLD